MTSSPQTSIRNRLAQSFIGPVTIALLFFFGVNGVVTIARYPLRLALVVLINRLIHQVHVDMIPLRADSWREITEFVGAAPVAAIGLLVVGTLLALWMFPESKSAGSEE